MIYVYDMILNWTDEDEVYEFFEWELNDDIEHIKRMPLFKVSSDLFDDLFNCEFKVDNEFLKKIYNLTERYTNNSVDKINYAVLLTDGIRVLAIEFDELGNSIYRSRMLLDEEQDVIVLSNKLENYNLNIIKGKRRTNNVFMTRLERNIKKTLTAEIHNGYKIHNYDKLKYLYFELFGKEQDDIELIYNKLLESIDKGINYTHNKLYEVIKLSYQNKN